MIHIINFLVKVILSIIMAYAYLFFVAAALIMWKEKFMIIPETAIKELWRKN